jgi:hypothetical protein
MIIQFGKSKENPYGQWADDPRVFISQPYFKIVLDNGFGVYILNALKFSLFPKFYGTFRSSFWEFGFSFAGWTFEVMWNKAFAK